MYLFIYFFLCGGGKGGGRIKKKQKQIQYFSMDKLNVRLLQELIPSITAKYIDLNCCKYCGILTVSASKFQQKRCKRSQLSAKHFNAYKCVRCQRSICIGCKNKMHTLFIGKRKCCRECFLQ